MYLCGGGRRCRTSVAHRGWGLGQLFCSGRGAKWLGRVFDHHFRGVGDSGSMMHLPAQPGGGIEALRRRREHGITYFPATPRPRRFFKALAGTPRPRRCWKVGCPMLAPHRSRWGAWWGLSLARRKTMTTHGVRDVLQKQHLRAAEYVFRGARRYRIGRHVRGMGNLQYVNLNS